MISITLAITLLFSLFVIRTKPGTAMGLVIACMMIWPEFLRIPIGLAQMSAPRLVTIVLLTRLLMFERRSFKNRSPVDALVIIGWLWTIFAAVAVDSKLYHVTQMVGRGFDTVLMYFVARIAIMTIDDVKDIMMPLAITAVYMCGIGILEAMMLYSPYESLQAFRTWTWIVDTGDASEMRYGFHRAKASTSQPIYYGMAMMLIAGILWSTRVYRTTQIANSSSIFAAFIGALTSFSSGVWIGCALLVLFNAFVKRVSAIKPAIYILSFSFIFLEILSNRHFYNLIDYLAMNSKNAWYRTRLLEVAITRLEEFWLFGVGNNTPHHWGTAIDGRWYIDLVNHFLILALYGGIPALIIYALSHILALRTAVCNWQLSNDQNYRKLIFGLAACLIALDVASMSVGLYGPAILLSYILLGILVSLSRDLK